jgi:hypothetical protein
MDSKGNHSAVFFRSLIPTLHAVLLCCLYSNWRVGMTLKVAELQPIMLSVRQCSIARALYTVQLAMLQQFTFVKKKLAERLDTAIDEIFIWLATLPPPNAVSSGGEAKGSQRSDDDDDDRDEHDSKTPSAVDRPSGEELRAAMAISRRLKDQVCRCLRSMRSIVACDHCVEHCSYQCSLSLSFIMHR